MSSIGILPGSSLTETQQFDPAYQYQAGKSGQKRPMYPLNIVLPPYGEKYAYSLYPPYSGGLPYGNIPEFSGQSRIGVCQWKPIMTIHLRLTQPMKTVSVIPTTPVLTTVPQSQVQTIVSQLVQSDPSTFQPQILGQEVQVPQVFVQQPLVSGA